MHGFSIALTPINLLWGFLGVMLGTFIGVLPGVGPALTVAMLMPLTVKLNPTGALIMFAGIYYGAMYGGSTTTILLNTPGESASIVTGCGRKPNGEERPRRSGAGHLCHRLLRRRHDRYYSRHTPRAYHCRSRAEIRPGGIFRANGFCFHHGLRCHRQLHLTRPDQFVSRFAAWRCRHR